MRNKQKKKSKSRSNHVSRILKKIVVYIGVAASIATILQLFLNASSTVDESHNMNSNNNKDSKINQFSVEQGNIYINTTHIDAEETGLDQNTLNASTEQQIAYSYDLIQQGNYELAAKVLQAFIDRGNVGPMDMAVLHYNLGVAYYYQENYALAKKEAEAALKTVGFADAYYLLGIISGYIFDDYPEAIDAFSNALEYETKPEYLLARAWAYENNGQPQEAEKDYETISTIDM